MLTAAEEHLPIARVQKGLPFPECWDSTSFAHNLKAAYEGFQMHKKIRSAGDPLHEKLEEKWLRGPLPLSPNFVKFRVSGRGARGPTEGIFSIQKNRTYPSIPSPGAFLSGFHGLQKTAYAVIFDEVFKDSPSTHILSLCKKRLFEMFSPYDIFADGETNVELALETLHKSGGHVVTKVIKTWLHGWVTSHRMTEDLILPCLLGCHGHEDSLKHYVMCPHMYAMQQFLIAEEVSSDPLVRIGIKNPSIHSMLINSCLFSAYHAVKAKVRAGLIDLHQDIMTTQAIQATWSVFADAFKAEAGGLRVHTRAFSLPKFISFLSSGILPREVLPIANSVRSSIQ